jgi:SPP1 gp7 family putative phage head morphogenesis protein
MPDLRITKVKLKDATQTTLLYRQYKKDIIQLYDKFGEQLGKQLPMLNIRQDGIQRQLGLLFDNTSEATIYAGAPRIIEKNITLAYKSGKRKAATNPRIVRNSIIIPISSNMMDKKIIEDLKARNFSRVVKATEDMKTDMMRVFSEDLLQGKGINQITKDLMDNITDISRARAQVIARTETAFAHNNAISKTYQAEGIEQWQWLATLGVNCCETCIANHGQIFNWGDPQPPSPHPNCLCSILPVIKKEKKT